MNPRNKSRAARVLAGFLLLPSVGMADEQPAIPIIDCHVHLFDIARPAGIGWIKKDDKVLYRSFLPKDHEPIAKANGVRGVVVVQAGQSLPDNQWNLDITAHNKKLYRGVVGNLSEVIGTPDFKPLFEKLCEDPRYVGYRLSGRFQEGLTEEFFRDLELTVEKGRTVDFLLGGYSLAEVDQIAKRMPKLKIIIDHFGGVALDGKPLDPEWVKSFLTVSKRPNVICKVSALYGRFKEQPAPREIAPYQEILDLAWQSFGEDRLIYGSDWPVTRTTGDYASVVALTKTYFDAKGRAAEEKLFHDNAVRFYGIPDLEDRRSGAVEEPVYDLVIYGDSSAAVTAAVAAKRQGRSVVLVNPTGFLGGMSSSGLGATDFLGKRGTFGGIASEFYDAVAASYGTGFVRSFEPHVGKQVFEKMIADAGVTVVFNEQLNRENVNMNDKRIDSITMLSGKTYRARMFIDTTYVGDLMAAAGVSHTVGREPESQYGEDLAGVRRGDTKPRVHYTQGNKDHFIKDVDPFVKPGEPDSGLLPHVFHVDGIGNGQGDKKIQAYNYRVCLTNDPGLRTPIEKPAGYREIDHELLLRNFDAGDDRLPALIEPLAGSGSKVDWNNMHAVGSDFPGANWEYPEASYEKRREIEKAHETYIRGFLWTLANNQRVPAPIREKAAAYGLPKDEFTDNGGWPWMIYIREARRMVSDYVMTQHDCEGKRAASDPIGLGSFGMDSHVVQHFVTEGGKAQNDGVIWRVPPKPYGISYRSIIPRKGECENLLSPVCLSASHVAHGSIRMEPVFMALGQSAAIAAGLAIDGNVSVQDVDYAKLRERLDAGGQVVRADSTSAVSPSRQNLVGILADDSGT